MRGAQLPPPGSERDKFLSRAQQCDRALKLAGRQSFGSNALGQAPRQLFDGFARHAT
jgi:hypothetical protein